MSHRCFFKKKSDYLYALRSRRSVRNKGWKLHYVRNTTAPRFAAVIAKRHVRTAVQRNRIRRVLCEYFRQQLQFELQPMDYLMKTISPQPVSLSGDYLRAQCRYLCRSAAKKNYE